MNYDYLYINNYLGKAYKAESIEMMAHITKDAISRFISNVNNTNYTTDNIKAGSLAKLLGIDESIIETLTTKFEEFAPEVSAEQAYKYYGAYTTFADRVDDFIEMRDLYDLDTMIDYYRDAVADAYNDNETSTFISLIKASVTDFFASMQEDYTEMFISEEIETLPELLKMDLGSVDTLREIMNIQFKEAVEEQIEEYYATFKEFVSATDSFISEHLIPFLESGGCDK